MNSAILEHVNVTVSDPEKTADMLCDLFNWQIRWSGDSINGGRTIHVGAEGSYVALYSPKDAVGASGSSYENLGGLNHIAVVVKDLEDVESRVKTAGFSPVNHADYEPGRRFYFRDHDNIEYEVVAYDE
ncbi:glyoxalase [Rhodobacterales bacterium 52_120_T64]|nr:glyoxalase [Rhodobacterales bacterium 52_120_T64]